MIDKLTVFDIVTTALEGTDKFLVDLKITPDNRIFISIDGDNGVIIDDCVELSHIIEDKLDREVEDYELNVASAGLESPLRNVRQYRRNIGREVTVTLMTGDKYQGILKEAGDQQFAVSVPQTKRTPEHDETFAYKDVKATKIVIKF